MNPALSVVFFTTLSGAGLGLLLLLGLAHAPDVPLLPRWTALVALVAGAVLLAAGLLASVLHLGRPERMWRALSQWRSSWLSREGVLALATFMPAIALGWMLLPERAPGPAARVAAIALALLAAATLYATSRIYTSLKTIPAWHNAWVLPNYTLLGLATGMLWLGAITTVTSHGAPSPGQALAFASLVAAAFVAKLGYWRHVANAPLAHTMESATGLGRYGKVSAFEAPHTETNYLLREMGFVLARRHARALRAIALVLAYAVPLAAALVSIAMSRTAFAATWLALAAATLGVFVERWLFFAEARHVVTLYYGTRGAT